MTTAHIAAAALGLRECRGPREERLHTGTGVSLGWSRIGRMRCGREPEIQPKKRTGKWAGFPVMAKTHSA